MFTSKGQTQLDYLSTHVQDMCKKCGNVCKCVCHHVNTASTFLVGSSNITFGKGENLLCCFYTSIETRQTPFTSGADLFQQSGYLPADKEYKEHHTYADLPRSQAHKPILDEEQVKMQWVTIITIPSTLLPLCKKTIIMIIIINQIHWWKPPNLNPIENVWIS